MKKTGYILFILVVLAHFVLLYFFGISAFTTTVLFYILLFLSFKFLVNRYGNPERRKVILFNLKLILAIVLVYEFSATFIFNLQNSFMEKKMGIYTSLYRHKEQMQLLTIFRTAPYRDNWEDGYTPFYSHFHETVDFKYKASYNSAGLRGPEPLPDTDSVITIAVLGDSFAEGYGASGDSTFPKQLEYYLRRQNKNVHVINAGVCGSNPLPASRLYNRIVKKYKPDIILFEINSDDPGEFYISKHSHSMPLREALYAVSHVYRSLDGFFTHSAFNNEKKKKQADEMLGFLKEFNGRLEDKQQLVLLPLPMQSHIYEARSAMDSAILNSGIPFVDLQKQYRKYMRNTEEDLNMFYWKHDRHHTPKGYDLMAKIISEDLLVKHYAGAD